MTSNEINEIRIALCDGCERLGKYCPDCTYSAMVEKLKKETKALEKYERELPQKEKARSSANRCKLEASEQIEALMLVAKGYTYKEVAKRFGVTYTLISRLQQRWESTQLGITKEQAQWLARRVK